jgi:hypothetical protein
LLDKHQRIEIGAELPHLNLFHDGRVKMGHHYTRTSRILVVELFGDLGQSIDSRLQRYVRLCSCCKDNEKFRYLQFFFRFLFLFIKHSLSIKFKFI